MNKNLLLFIVLTFAFTASSQEYKRMSSINEQLEDFKVFKTTLLECHIGIFDYNDSLSLFSNLSEMERDLKAKPLSKIEQLAIYSKFVASINCIHSYVYHEKMTWKSLKANYKFPFDVYFFNNELRAEENYFSDKIEVYQNDQILSINGELVSEIRDSLYQFISSDGNSETRKSQVLKNNFLYYYFLYKPSESDFSIEYIHGNDTLKKKFSACRSKNLKKSKAKTNSIRFSIDSVGSTAILTLTMPLEMNKEYKQSLSAFMATINDLKIDNLILDLRNNPGGKSQNYFAGYFIDSAIEYERIESNSIHNATYKKYFINKMKLQYIISNFSGRMTAQNTPYQYVEPQQQYSGKLFILVNGNTASAASNFASILKEWTNALVIGEETGGGYKFCNTGGGVLKLPNSKFKVAIRTLKATVNTCYEHDADGVSPNLTVLESDYYKLNGDAQLEFILKNLIPDNVTFK